MTKPTWSAALLALFLVASCDQAAIVWVPFNADEQQISLLVQESCTPEEAAPIELELLSSLAKRVVGTAIVDPGCGPIGTYHDLTVEVLDEWEEIVGRVTVGILPEAATDLDGDGEPDSRGEDEHELRRDSADLGIYALTLQSQGTEGETRQDLFEVVLWQPEELEENVETIAGSE